MVPLFDAFIQSETPHPAAQNFVTKKTVFVADHGEIFGS